MTLSQYHRTKRETLSCKAPNIAALFFDQPDSDKMLHDRDAAAPEKALRRNEFYTEFLDGMEHS